MIAKYYYFYSQFSYIMNMKEMPRATGSWNLTIEMKSDAEPYHASFRQIGVFLKSIKLARIPVARSNEDIRPQEVNTARSNEDIRPQEANTASSSPTSSTFTTTPPTTIRTEPTRPRFPQGYTQAPCETNDELILGTKTKEMFVLILAVFFILTSIVLTLKYIQLKDKHKNYVYDHRNKRDSAALPPGRNEALVR